MQRMVRNTLLLIAGASALASQHAFNTARAASPRKEAVEQISAFRGNSSFQEAAFASFRAFEAKLTTHCQAVTADWGSATHVEYSAPATDEDGRIVRASWIERVPGIACGQRRDYRVRVQIADGKGSVIPMLPGTGLSSPDLPEAVGAVEAAVKAYQVSRNNCQVDVLDTQLKSTYLAEEKQPWTELWTVRSCGKKMTVPVRFTPLAQATGTDIDIDPGKITLAQ